MNELNASIRAIPIPDRMRRLPISATGYPVPWFVKWLNGEPDFRIVDAPKVGRAVRANLCWLCGQTLGRHKAFVIGPMCAVNRVSSEPPCHRDCAEYAVKACPFLTKPKMRRNDKDRPTEGVEPAGVMIQRNPGVSLIWITNGYTTFRADGGSLFKIGPPEQVHFYAEGRKATRAEVLASIETGLPLLREVAERQGHEAIVALEHQTRAAMMLVDTALAA